MANYELDKQLKTLSGYVYGDKSSTKPAGWIDVTTSENKNTGFYAQTFYKNNTVVISFRGTDITKGISEAKKDIDNDLNMAKDCLPAQTVDAEKFYQETKDAFPNQNIILTGHSLGGSLAQIIGSETGAQTVTFNAFGTGGIVQDPTYTDNITNYGNPNDPVFLSNVDNQIGNTYLTNVSDTQNNGDLVAQKNSDWSYNKDLGFDNHKLENMGDLSKSVEYDKNTPLGDSVLKASVEVNVDENGNKIFTREDIAKMTPEEYQKNESAIMAQMKESGIPTKAQADAKTKTSANSNASKSGGNSKASGGSASGDGNWVTINGHHVLLD